MPIDSIINIPLVTVHELGHALAVKAAGMKIDNVSMKFYNFLNPTKNVKYKLNFLNTPINIEFFESCPDKQTEGYVFWSSPRLPANSPEYRKRLAFISLAGPITGLLFGGAINFTIKYLSGDKAVDSMYSAGRYLLASLILQEGAIFLSTFEFGSKVSESTKESPGFLWSMIAQAELCFSIYYMIVNWANIFNPDDHSDGIQFIKAFYNQPKDIQRYKNISHMVCYAGSLRKSQGIKLMSLSRLALGVLVAGIQVLYSSENR
jgi:hypothetical protein